MGPDESSEGERTMAAAAEALGLSERQLWRLRRAFERDGPAGLVHGNRGRPAPQMVWPAQDGCELAAVDFFRPSRLAAPRGRRAGDTSVLVHSSWS